jgi:hypothetical protein
LARDRGEDARASSCRASPCTRSTGATTRITEKFLRAARVRSPGTRRRAPLVREHASLPLRVVFNVHFALDVDAARVFRTVVACARDVAHRR